MKVRRVVTGHEGDKAVFASDQEVEPVTLALAPGVEFHRLWGGDQVPAFPALEADDEVRLVIVRLAVVKIGDRKP